MAPPTGPPRSLKKLRWTSTAFWSRATLTPSTQVSTRARSISPAPVGTEHAGEGGSPWWEQNQAAEELPGDHVTSIFLTFRLLHLTQSQVLGSDDWVEGLHVGSVDEDGMLRGAPLGRQVRPGLIPVVADQPGTQMSLALAHS